MKLKILALDLSYAKTGWSISIIDNDEVSLVDCGLLISDKSLFPIERIDSHISDIQNVINKYKPDLVIKESAIMGRSSTGLNVIKLHGAFEYMCYNELIPIEEVHNQTIKAWSRRQIENHKDYDKKLIVALSIEKYYNRKINDIWTERGRLLDDIADSIAIPIVWLSKKSS